MVGWGHGESRVEAGLVISNSTPVIGAIYTSTQTMRKSVRHAGPQSSSRHHLPKHGHRPPWINGSRILGTAESLPTNDHRGGGSCPVISVSDCDVLEDRSAAGLRNWSVKRVKRTVGPAAFVMPGSAVAAAGAPRR